MKEPSKSISVQTGLWTSSGTRNDATGPGKELRLPLAYRQGAVSNSQD